jgi:hypothetical protein
MVYSALGDRLLACRGCISGQIVAGRAHLPQYLAELRGLRTRGRDRRIQRDLPPGPGALVAEHVLGRQAFDGFGRGGQR